MNASTRGGRVSPSIEALLDSVADSSTPVAVRRASCAPRVSSSDLGDGWARDTAGGRSARPDSRRNRSATLRPPPAAAAAVARRAPGSRGGTDPSQQLGNRYSGAGRRRPVCGCGVGHDQPSSRAVGSDVLCRTTPCRCRSESSDHPHHTRRTAFVHDSCCWQANSAGQPTAIRFRVV